MSDTVTFSIIVVCLNAGKRLEETIESILKQNYNSYEIIIKDGGSTDGSIEALREYLSKDVVQENHQIVLGEKNIDAFAQEEFLTGRIRVFQQEDKGIYDAMNQAISYATGDYLLFLNTGDSLYEETTLEKITDGINEKKEQNGKRPDIVYGNLYHKALQSVIFAAPQINDFTCYRNVPCHQTCFYHRSMFAERGYEPRYNVRADYEHFLWCYYEKKADIQYLPVLTASYEGGGYSETKENKKRSARQHREIVVYYMGKRKANKYRMIMLLTLAPLRSKLAENVTFSKFYNMIKRVIYLLKNK